MLTIRATTTNAELDAIPFVDMRSHAVERRDDAVAVLAECGDQDVLEYVSFDDGVCVLFSPVWGYAYCNKHSSGVGDSFIIENNGAESAEDAADIFRAL